MTRAELRQNVAEIIHEYDPDFDSALVLADKVIRAVLEEAAITAEVEARNGPNCDGWHIAKAIRALVPGE